MREPAERAYFEAEVAPLLSGTSDEVVELGLDDRVEVVGSAAGLVNPIDWPEPFGLVMAESLAAGTPVVARPRGAAPEIVSSGRTGYLVDDLAEGVRAVTELDRIDRRRCRAVAESRFSLERMAREHERLYERVLAGPALPAPRRVRRVRPGTVANPARTSVQP
jgi:glycosyltransferase involved in cell wall biosynthesis